MNDRRSSQFLQGREIKFRAIYTSSLDWRLFTDSLFFLAASSRDFNVTAGLRPQAWGPLPLSSALVV